jgi:ketosteroid isomerase-like protein
VSDANVQIVRRVYDALAHPGEDITALWHPDVEFDVSRDIWGAVVGGGHYRGIDGVRAWMLDLYAAWEQMDIEVEELIDAGDKVVAVIRVTGRGRVSGIEIEYSPAGVWTIRDGRIVRVVWFVARDDALEAAGVES